MFISKTEILGYEELGRGSSCLLSVQIIGGYIKDQTNIIQTKTRNKTCILRVRINTLWETFSIEDVYAHLHTEFTSR